MSIHPSPSWSRNAHPAPVVSGKYFSVDFPLVWVQVIPLTAERISSNGYGGAASAREKRDRRGSIRLPPIPPRKNRRENCEDVRVGGGVFCTAIILLDRRR